MKQKSISQKESKIEIILWEIYNLGIRNSRQGYKENEWARSDINNAISQITEVIKAEKKKQQCGLGIFEKGWNSAIDKIAEVINR